MYEKDPVRIFVVEDDPAYAKFLKYVLGLNPDFEAEFFTTGKDCLNNLHKNPAVADVVVSLEDKLVAVQTKEGTDISDQELRTTLTDAGYDIKSIERTETSIAAIRERLKGSVK